MGRYAMLVMFALLIGCKQRNNHRRTENKYLSDGTTVISSIDYDEEGKEHGRYKMFYPSGQLAVSTHYEHGKINGRYFEYYDNGKVKESGMYFLGTRLGSYYYYNLDGRLRRYNTFDYQDNVVYVVKFDSVGNKIKEEGLAVSPVASSPTYKKQYYKGDSVVLQYCIAQPPGYHSKAFIGVYRQKQLIQPFAEYPINKLSLAEIKYQFKDTGFYAVACIGELTDTTDNWKKRDTTFSEFLVR